MKQIQRFGLLACLIISINAYATDYYVNPQGNDEWTGGLKTANATQTDGPFKTLERAKQAIRGLKKSGTYNDKVTVNIAGGTYTLTHPLHFSLMDTGLPDREIIWQGEQGAKVIISGGIALNCSQQTNNQWECPVPQEPINPQFFDAQRIKGNAPKFELYVNQQKLHLARWPDAGWAHIKLPLDKDTQFTVMEPLPDMPDDIKNAQAHIFASNDWYDQYTAIDTINPANNSLKLSSSTAFPLDSGRRFYLQNLPSFLNAPSEWLYDEANKKIKFITPVGINPTEIVVSSVPNLLIAEGIKNISFKNISFQNSTATAVTVTDSNEITLDELDIHNIDGIGIHINAGKNVQLINSQIHHTGAHGVIVTGGDKLTLMPSGHVIYNNHIHDVSTKLLTMAPGIEVNGVAVSITHNLLEHGSGIAVLATGNEHLIEKNDISHFCEQSADCGAFYSGRDWSWRGNIIRNNYFHDMISYGLQSVNVANNQVVYADTASVGVYLDDGGSGFEISNNIFENAGTMSIQVGGGRDNKIFNNYFKTNYYAILVDDRWPAYDWNQNAKNLSASPYQTALWQQKYPELAAPMFNRTWPEGNKIERNIMVTGKPNGLLMRYFVPMQSTVIGHNLVWATEGKPTIDYKILDLNKLFGGTSWQQWLAEGIERNSVLADPCISIVNKKLSACTASPLKDIGFQPIAPDIGLVK